LGIILDKIISKKIIDKFSEYDLLKLESNAFIQRFSLDMNDIFYTDKVEVNIYLPKKDRNLSDNESLIEFSSIYIDNKLNENSTFSLLITYFKQGYKSCGIFPIYSNSKNVGFITVLSVMENRFNDEFVNEFLITSTLFGYYFSLYLEREKELNLAKYFNAAFDSIIPQVLIEKSGNVVKANKAFLIITNKNLKEVTGKNIYQLVKANGEFGKKTDKENIKIIGEDNKIRNFKAVQKDVNENIKHILFIDFTSFNEIEYKVKALNYLNDIAILILKQDTTIEWSSTGIINIIKIPQEKIVNFKLKDIIQNWEEIEKNIEIDAQHIFSGNIQMNLNNNLLNVKIFLIKNENIFTCILYSNQKDMYINTIKSYVERLIAFSNDIIILTDELGYINKLNASAKNILGYTIEEIFGKPINFIYADGESQDVLTRGLSIAKHTNISRMENVEFKVKGKDKAIPCEAGISSMMDEFGNFIGYMVIAHEKATKMENEFLKIQLDKSNHDKIELKSESDLKTQFIYNISHDLKTPITNIKGFSKLLFDGEFGEMNKEQKEYIEIIYNESERFTKLIQQILDVAKLSEQKTKLEMQEMSFDNLKDNPSIKAMEETARRKGLEFRWIVDYDVPIVNADPNKIIQVFVNLIGNAIKFTETGSIEIHVYRKMKKNKIIKIDVKDTGMGINKDDQKKMFKKFYQVQRKGLVMQEGAGTGLGLSIVKEIIDRHGGKVGLESDINKGSIFWFTLPITPKEKKSTNKKVKKDELQNTTTDKKI
jgi:PAS domain S-box-containing protein